MNSLIPLLALIRKDLILFVNDKRALLLTLLMPIVLAAFFGYIFGGSGKQEAAKIELGIVQQDEHLITKNIVAGLQKEAALNVKLMPLAQAQELVRKGKLSVAVVLPAGFGEAAGAALFNAKTKPELTFLFDPSQNAMLAMVKGMLTQQVMQSVSAEMFSGQAGGQLVDQSLAQLAQKQSEGKGEVQDKALSEFLSSYKKFQTSQTADSQQSNVTAKSGLSMPFTTREQAMVANDGLQGQYNAYAHAFAGMIVQFILFMAVDAGISVLLARKQGIWNRLLSAPIGLNSLIIARALSCALIAFFVTVVIYVVAIMVFKVQILGSLLGLVAVALSFALMTASFGLLIAAFGKTPEAARGISVFATLIMVMLGGAWVPSFLFPQWLQSITMYIPTRWAVDGFDAVTWRGLDFAAALPNVGALMAFTTIFSALALWRFNANKEQ
ncbi:ABC transporter permease [Undibacterium danionis]|uniref:ABC transporter permease n=1 Tax=Undibacterium danionis TaxID=1812100 RepID=A0ABV6IFV0_9BURK